VREIFTKREIQAQDRQFKVANVLSILPFAMITNAA
jgi:hypothetical protein